MADEMSGFPDEPTFSLAALAGHELTQERLYAAQNLLVKREAEIARLENERDGKVLVDPEDLRVFFARLSRGLFLRQDSEAGQAERRLRDAAGGLSHAGVSRDTPEGAHGVSDALSPSPGGAQ